MSTRVAQPRQNYHEESEAGVNKQINMGLYNSHVYHSMAYYFDRGDVALPGFHKYFSHASKEKRENAERLMKFQNQRGGRIVLQGIKKPERNEWGTGLDAMQASLALEKNTKQGLVDLHKVAGSHRDTEMCEYVEQHLRQQVESIMKISGHVTKLKQFNTDLGEYIFDKDSLDD